MSAELVLQVVRRVLGRDDVDERLPLFDQGLKSKALITLIVELEEQIGGPLPDSVLTPENFRSVASIAQALELPRPMPHGNDPSP